MEHLTEYEMLRFVSIENDDAESAALTARVNRHILECGRCAAALRRAVAYHCALGAMMREDFAPRHIALYALDVSPDEVAKAAKMPEENTAYNYR
ncbi:MAG: hypothetical protein IJQ80_07420 [Clostridia bacterium]|nr:hypothetical protein [Clostridia bacterium]